MALALPGGVADLAVSQSFRLQSCTGLPASPLQSLHVTVERANSWQSHGVSGALIATLPAAIVFAAVVRRATRTRSLSRNHVAFGGKRVPCIAMAASAESVHPPALIFGGGRVGEALFNMGNGNDVIVRRGDPFPADAPPGPIYVCTRNDALKGIIDMTPKERREDLIFIQNGALLPFLEQELGPLAAQTTVLLVYFAVAKKGESPIDGKTDTDPEGLSAVNASGKWAAEVAHRLTAGGLSIRELAEPLFSQAYWEKIVWIAAYMLIGTLHDGCKVGDVESEHREEVDALITELAGAVSDASPGIQWDTKVLCDRLAAYARSVAHFPTAVKEFEWRNGAFYNLTLQAKAAGKADPCPTHTAGLKQAGALPS